MAYFKDAQEVYDTIGKLFVDLAKDDELGPKFRKANTIVQYDYRDPESKITLQAAGGRARPTSTSARPRWSPRW